LSKERGSQLGSQANALQAHVDLETQTYYPALDALGIKGEVLELACGTGIWTQRLLGTASSITAVDASLEMQAINRAKVASDRVTYVQTDLFTWHPTCRYDAVCFAFCISHVPDERLDSFLSMVAIALRPGGTIFFADDRRESTGSAITDHLSESESQLIIRRLNDSRTFQIVKNFYEPATLAARFAVAGFDVTVVETANYFLYGYGTRGEASGASRPQL